MQIHNFLCDLLVSIKLLIDTYLFPHKPKYIKSYEFNLGNRSFQLSKEPNVNYSLPAVLVSINDETINFGGRRTDLIMRNDLDNINKTPVLYNETKNIVVYLHEEQTQVFFTITFNCETQLEAKEIAYTIKRSLPLNKNLNIFTFMSYLEIDNNLLLDLLNFNIPFDNIQNLYTKLNYNTNKPEYCFSLQHNPLVRLDSVSTNISDSSQSTFQTQLELTYTIPFPQYLVVEELNLIKTINFSFNIYNHPVVMIPSTKYYLGEKVNYKVDRCLLLQTEETTFPDGIKISKTDTQVYINIEFEFSDFVLDSKYLYRFYKIINNERVFFDKTPSYYYPSENKAVFIFTLDEYNTIIPENTSPMFIEFYYYLVDS